MQFVSIVFEIDSYRIKLKLNRRPLAFASYEAFF